MLVEQRLDLVRRDRRIERRERGLGAGAMVSLPAPTRTRARSGRDLVVEIDPRPALLGLVVKR